MKKIFPIITAVAGLAMLSSCSNSSIADEVIKKEEMPTITNAILVYMTAENNLDTQGFASADLNEIKSGSAKLNDGTAVLAFVDPASSTQKPYIRAYYNGKDTLLYTSPSDFVSTDPSKVTETLQRMVELTPDATSYSLIMWGHGTGPLVTADTLSILTKSTRSYGYDSTNNTESSKNNTWINVPALAKALAAVKDHSGNAMKYENIFFDCCCMGSVESAYEFRSIADYFVGIACETPGYGANYAVLLPAYNKTGEERAKSLVDSYVDGTNFVALGYSGVCISAVKLSQMDYFLGATSTALHTISYTDKLSLSTESSSASDVASDSYKPTSSIYYMKVNNDLTPTYIGMSVLYDMQDVMRANLSSEDYNEWLSAFNQTVFYKRRVTDIRKQPSVKPWMSEYLGKLSGKLTNDNEWYKFYISDESCGCISTIFPQIPTKTNYSAIAQKINEVHFQFEWWQKLWHQFGW